MELVTWECFKDTMQQWTLVEITDDQWYEFLSTSDFAESERRLANVFLKKREEGYWNASYYHVR